MGVHRKELSAEKPLCIYIFQNVTINAFRKSQFTQDFYLVLWTRRAHLILRRTSTMLHTFILDQVTAQHPRILHTFCLVTYRKLC